MNAQTREERDVFRLRFQRVIDAASEIGASSISGAAGGAMLGTAVGGFVGGVIGAVAGFALNAIVSGVAPRAQRHQATTQTDE